MKKRLLVGLLLAASSTPLMAATPSFDFVEFGYTTDNLDGISKNMNGTEYRINYSFKNNIYLAFDNFRVDLAGSELKFNIMSTGVGYSYGFSDNTVLYSELDVLVYDPDGHDTHVHGGEFTAGVRHMATDRLELKAAAEILDAKHYSTNTLLLGAAYNLTRHLSVYSDLRLEADSTRGSIGARFRF